jgi:hypothetical protein
VHLDQAHGGLFENAHLDAFVLPTFDVPDGDLRVDVLAQAGLAECSYTNDVPMWGDDGVYSEMDACWNGAEFPIHRVETVRARVVGGGFFSDARVMTWAIDGDSVAVAEPAETRTWACWWRLDENY